MYALLDREGYRVVIRAHLFGEARQLKENRVEYVRQNRQQRGHVHGRVVDLLLIQISLYLRQFLVRLLYLLARPVNGLLQEAIKNALLDEENDNRTVADSRKHLVYQIHGVVAPMSGVHNWVVYQKRYRVNDELLLDLIRGVNAQAKNFVQHRIAVRERAD